MKHESQSDDNPDLWKRMEPVVDAALRSLAAAYRDAVVLRYLDGQSYCEIARRLKISEEAARQRTSRGVAELRETLAKQGVVAPSVSAAGIEAILLANAVQNAPASLASACAVAGSGAAAPWLIAKGVMTMLLVKKIVLAGTLVLVLLSGIGVAVVVKSGADAGATEPKKPQVANKSRTMRPAVVGKVVDTDGKPISGALVYLADPDHPVSVYGDEQVKLAWIEGGPGYPNMTSYERKPANKVFTTTDAEGKFRFEAAEIRRVAPGQEWTAFRPDEWAVVVGSEGGFAHVTSAEFAASGGRIQLSAWGQVEGVLIREGKAVPNAPVRLARMVHIWQNWPFMVQYEDEVRTDAQGHFKFAQVASGNTWLMHSASGFSMAVGDPAAYVRIEAGKSHRVDLAPRGRPVIGQLVEPADARERMIWIDTYHSTWGMMRIEPFGVMLQPDNWHQLPPEQKTALWEKWSASEEGRIYCENLFPILVDVRPDGSFQIPDVPAGKYNLKLNSYHGRKAPELVAELNTVVQVEPVAPGQAAQPQDLGRLTVLVKERLQVGDAAPEFAVNRLDGHGQIRLSDYKGKLVLLHFWWSEMPVEALELKHFQRVAALAEREKDKLVIIGIGLGYDRERMRKRAEEGGMTWPQAGTEQGSKLTKDYHVTSYGVFLIGPDGKVLARQLTEREIMPAVEKALREMR